MAMLNAQAAAKKEKEDKLKNEESTAAETMSNALTLGKNFNATQLEMRLNAVREQKKAEQTVKTKKVVEDSQRNEKLLRLKEIEQDFQFLLDLDKSDDEDQDGIDSVGETKEQKDKRAQRKIKMPILPDSLNVLKQET